MTAVDLDGVTVTYGTGQHLMRAVDNVNLRVPADGVLGLVGESGSGKSTLARALVGLVDIDEGRILHDGQDLDDLPARARRQRRRRVQMVFQDPFGSLNPRMTVGDTLLEAIRTTRMLPRSMRSGEVVELLDLVSLDARYARLLPRELSGGQRQRVAIARALAAKPDVLVADEITSALDASVQGAILNLIRDLRERLRISVLLISHNLSVVRYVSDTIAVMYLGRVVETATTDELLTAPQHPYTRALLDAVPRLGLDALPTSAVLDEDPADPHDPPLGCHFHPRCPMGPVLHPDRVVCRTEDPSREAGTRPHQAACHFPGVHTLA